jgi:hypothetical protein
MASLRAASVYFSYTSIGYCKHSKHIGELNLLLPILRVIYNNTGGFAKRECGELQFSL